MFMKIIAFFMSIITFVLNLFGVGTVEINNYIYENYSYGTHERHTLDLYIPKYKDEVGLVLFIHGGAWIGGDKEGYTNMLKDIANDGEYACAAINYRYICDEIDLNDLMDDVQLAVECIKKLGEENGVNINKMLLTGGSAGAHMSLLFAYSRDDVSAIKPVAVVSDCGPTDLTEEKYYFDNAIGDKDVIANLVSWACGKRITYETRHEAEEEIKKVSPLYYVDENTVPTIINHGSKDNVVPFENAVALDEKLTQYGVEHIFNVFPNSDHGLASDPDVRALSDEQMKEYMEKYLCN
ncbi:MAG: alpha/beta hydrolase [Clostridia bacterium]|nr:alpha/beta hydrolase [Clostridia bacterium]